MADGGGIVILRRLLKYAVRATWKMTSDNDSNVCIVKYIDASSLSIHPFTPIATHTSFHSLISQIEAKCPRGFSCTQPVAVYRDMLWWVQQVDDVVLDPPMDVGAYSAVRWGKMADKEPRVVMVCVEIERK